MKNSNWDRNELLNYGKVLESKKIPKDLNKYKIIAHDFQVINNLLNSIDEKKKFGINYTNPFKPFYININSNEIKSMIKLEYLFIERIPYTFSKIKSTDLNDEKLKMLFIKFLKNFDYELYDIYINLLKDKHICINNNIRENGNIQQLITFNKYFINIKNDSFKYFNLIHEMGHIKQFRICNDDINKLEKLYKSLFVEIYSKYLELKWFEYLKKEGYTDISLKWEEDFLTALSIYSERMLIFYNSCNTFEINKNHFLINFIGYRFSIALKNKNNLDLENINNIICTNDNFNSFNKINKILDEKEMYDVIKDFVSNYKEEFYKQKQLKKYL